MDGIHVYGDVESYSHQAFGRWAWFVPVEFGLLGACAGLAMPSLERALTGAARRSSWGAARAVGEAALFVGLYLCTAAVDGHGAWPALLAAALAGLAVARLVVAPIPGDWAWALGAAIAGPLAESALSATGVFEYSHADFARIPIWLPALWANGGLMIRRVIGAIVLAPDPRASNGNPAGGRGYPHQ